MNKLFSIVFLVSLVTVVSCDDEEQIFPVIETQDITPVSASNFLVKGNVIATGNSLVLEYGFVYSITSSVPDVFQGIKTVVGNRAETGVFERNISLASQPEISSGYTIFVRAYLTNQKGTVYGAIKEFTVPTLVVSSVAPLQAKTGAEITITGNNFSLSPEENLVKFNDIEAEVMGTTATSLLVKVPPGILYPSYLENNRITVTTGGQTVTATENFRVIPTVTDFSPKTGTFNTSVTITGSDFYPFGTAVRIGGKTASATSISDTEVTFNIPGDVTSPNLTMQLLSGNDIIDIINIPGTFTITVPQITSVTPLIGIGGTRVTITGNNFNVGSFNFTNNVVKFGTVEASAFSTSQDEIVAFVPKGLAVGNYPVSVFTGIHTVSFATNFTLTSPMISNFTPSSGIAGSYVTITGTHFGIYDQSNSVLFGNTPVDLYNWDETTIIVFIPVGTPSGTMKITVNASGQSVTSVNNFTIL